MKKKGNVSIVNEGEKFDSKRYDFLVGDIDGDGTKNVDDKYPFDKEKTGYVEASPLSESITNLIDLKESLDETMYDTVDKIVAFSPGSDVYARTKTPFSIINKLVKKRLLDVNKGLTDLVGTTIAVDNLKELKRVRDEIREGKLGTVLEEENFYDNPKGGYQAIHYILNIDGNQVEVQLKTKRTKEFNELTHEAYKRGKLNVENVNYIMDIINSADMGNELDIMKFDSLMTDKENVKKMISEKMEKGGELDNLLSESSYEGTSLPYTFSITNTSATPESATISPISVMAKGGEIEKIRNFRDELDLVVDEKCKSLECDGTSRIIDYVASLNGIQTQPKMGAIIKKNGSDIVDGFEPHFWNEIYIDGEKYIIDYRAQMWLGDSAPHGLFKESDLKNWEYIGDNVNFDRKISSIFYTTRGNDWDELINEYNK
tara:strand:- start:3050 stop:4339 length:1290 start_codon:yes stop_codon:yes gene_type:complete